MIYKFTRSIFIIMAVLSAIIGDSQNLLTNGDFESGGAGTGFQTNYILVGSNSGARNYAIVSNPAPINANFSSSCVDHTSTGNKMMVVDGANSGANNDKIWEALTSTGGGGGIPVTIGTTYTFSYWIQSISTTNNAGNLADIQVKINNVDIAPTIGSSICPPTLCVWAQVTYTWTATSGFAQIWLFDRQVSSTGNDFALDDFSLTASPQPLSVTYSITNPTCPGINDGTIFGYGVGGTQPYTLYTLSGPTSVPNNSTGQFTGLGPGNYTLTVTDNTGATATQNGIIVPNAPDLTLTTTNASICTGGSTTLNVSGGGSLGYSWSSVPVDPTLTATGSSQTVQPTAASTVYTVTAITNTPNNLIYNGDFFLGNVGFTSDYTYYNPSNPTGIQKAYGIVTNASTWEPSFSALCKDHTTTTGNMMIVDGSITNSGNDKVWCQTIPVSPGQNYTLSYWIQTISGPALANVELLINGISQGIYTPPGAICTWSQKSYVWNSGANTTAEICFYDRNTAAAGNDFALDDITFARINTCNLQKSISIAVVNTINLTITSPPAVCAPATVNITAAAVTAGSTVGTTLTYWTNAAATIPLTNIAASVIAVSGTYYIKSTLGSCSVIKPVVVIISTTGTVAPPIVTSPVRYCIGSVASPLTATALPGGTLNWYGTDSTGGTASTTAPTPSTLTGGNTIYYVSQTVGTCESTRKPITVIVALLSYGIFCDQNQATTSPVTSVYFDWQNVSNPPPLYNITYSINGGPPVIATPTNLSHFEVFGVTSGQSVSLTITSSTGYPCIPPETQVCSNCVTSTIPVFNSLNTTLCSTDLATYVLPPNANNGITGTWSPSTVTATGNYTFTPNPIQHPCASQLVVAFTVVPYINITTNIVGDNSMCVGSTATFTHITPGGVWSSSNTSRATVSATGLVTALSAGNVTIEYTTNLGGPCIPRRAAFGVVITAPTNAGTLSGNQALCIGQTTTFTPSVPGGSWSSSNTTFATVNASGVITGVASGTATITYTVTGTGGCPNATTTRTVTVSAPPNTGTLSGTQNVCVGLTTAFLSTTTGGTWSSANTATATVNAATGTVTGVGVGTTTIDYTVTGTGGCPNATASRTVTVSTPPTPGTLSGNQNICIAATTTFTSTIIGGSWSSSDITIATVNSGTGVITGVAAGTSTITYTVTGTGGCANVTSTRTVTVSAIPNPGTLSGNQAICIGFSTTFTSTTPGGSWVSSTPAIATVNAAGDIIGVSAGTATITYTVTGTGGCPNASTTRTITVTAAPNPGVLSGTQTICAGQTTTFTSTVSGGSWTSASPTIATIDPLTGVIVGVTGGNATMIYTVTGTGGCANTTATRAVTVNSNVLPTFTQVAPICSGNALAALPTTSLNGITGAWTPSIDNTNTTLYSFAPTAGLCALPTNMTIVVNLRVTPLFGLFAPLCQGAPAPILPTSSDNIPAITGAWSPPVSTTTLGTTIYTFTPTAGQCVSITPTTLVLTVVPVLTPNFPQIPAFCEGKAAPVLQTTSPNGVDGIWSPAVISNTVPGSYLFTPNPGQCALTQTLNVTLIPRTVPDFAAIPAFCKGTPAPLLPATSPNGITGIWSPALVDNTNSGVGFPYVFTPDEPTECATMFTMFITVIEPADPGFFDFGICTGSIAPPLANISPNGISGSWSPPTVDNLVSGSYLFSPDVGECALSQTIAVTVNQYTLTAIDGFVTNYFEDNQVVTILATDPGNYLYQLDFGPLQQSNVFQNVGIGVHTIKVIDANGCSNPLTGEILVINYPKYFTPNDDTYNDTWNISGLKNQQDSKISIFDRYGKLLKQISPSGTGWDGTYNGQRMPSTDYWFSVEYTENGSKREFKSHFSLKR